MARETPFSSRAPKQCEMTVSYTHLLGGLCAWPVSVLFMEGDAATLAVTAYIIPFLISTVVGSIIAGVLVFALRAGGALKMMQRSLELK